MIEDIGQLEKEELELGEMQLEEVLLVLLLGPVRVQVQMLELELGQRKGQLKEQQQEVLIGQMEQVHFYYFR
jgi:hypothetical protein